MKEKPRIKFNKDRCKKCIYRGRSSFLMIFCNYASITGETCLRVDPNGKVRDIRGDDFEGCALFEKGIALRDYETGGTEDE